MKKKIKKPKRSKRFKWLQRIRSDDRLWKFALLSLLNDKITIQEFEDLIKGRFITAYTFGTIAWMIFRVAKKVAYLEDELRKMKYVQHLREKKYLRQIDTLERAIREAD